MGLSCICVNKIWIHTIFFLSNTKRKEVKKEGFATINTRGNSKKFYTQGKKRPI
jgi:hypothetical protein